MKENNSHSHAHNLSLAGIFITLGIIFGDIGTSPLYVLKAIIGTHPIEADYVLGGLSCVFWTLTLQTTLKYVIITLNADNKGEGGIFSLYTLVRKLKKKWLLFPAIIGGSALLADGIITPSISVSSAVEGLRNIEVFKNLETIPIVMLIITFLFVIQQFGTKLVGKSFGPIMLIWFTMLAALGIYQLSSNWSVLAAFNPYYAYNLLANHPEGFWILGAVFLCTTGAEALYSDLGHCGKQNIRIAWIFVKISLILNYFGQGAWLLQHTGTKLNGVNPFYAVMPEWFLIFGIIIATLATIVASQALISGSFTLINEAIRLNLWPKVKIIFPTEMKGQLYIPSINWFLLVGCLGIVLYFKESHNMEAAYGLAIVGAMLMTTTLLAYYMIVSRYNKLLVALVISMYFAIEVAFLIANMSKFTHGGWVTLVIAIFLILVMWIWHKAKILKAAYVENVKINKYIQIMHDLKVDNSVQKYATNLVYLTSTSDHNSIEKSVIYSIFQKQPKRADNYWFLHVEVTDEPYTMEYKLTVLEEREIFRIDFKLGFRIEPKINILFRKVVGEMIRNNEVDINSRYESLKKHNMVGDFRFVVIEKYMSRDNDFSPLKKVIFDFYYWLKKMSLSEHIAFGLDTSSVNVEKVPLIISPPDDMNLVRVD